MARAATLLLLLAATAPPPTARLELTITGLRSGAGLVAICVTPDADHFPDCRDDPAARRLTLPAARADHVEIAGLPFGSYAIALIHDENGNGRLDTRLGVPTEGFGFSNVTHLTMGPPRFAKAAVAVSQPVVNVTVPVRYVF